MDALHDAAFNSPVTEDHLAKVIELWSGIPASKVKESELQKVADPGNWPEKADHRAG